MKTLSAEKLKSILGQITRKSPFIFFNLSARNRHLGSFLEKDLKFQHDIQSKMDSPRSTQTSRPNSLEGSSRVPTNTGKRLWEGVQSIEKSVQSAKKLKVNLNLRKETRTKNCPRCGEKSIIQKRKCETCNHNFISVLAKKREEEKKRLSVSDESTWITKLNSKGNLGDMRWVEQDMSQTAESQFVTQQKTKPMNISSSTTNREFKKNHFTLRKPKVEQSQHEEQHEYTESSSSEEDDDDNTQFIVPFSYVKKKLCLCCYKRIDRSRIFKIWKHGKKMKCYSFDEWPTCL